MMGYWRTDDGNIIELNALQEAAINVGQLSGISDGPYVSIDDIPPANVAETLVTPDGLNPVQMAPKHPLEHPISVTAFAIIGVILLCKGMEKVR
jgi:hypothetical protein